MQIEALTDAGLTLAEAKTYLALLELGTSQVGPIMARSGLQSSVTHLSLNNLVNKGFVSFVSQGKRRQYQAANPKYLLEYLNEKREQVESIMPELMAKQNSANQQVEAAIFRGVRGIKELLYELLETGGKEHHTFGSTNKSLMLGEEWWVRYHKKRAAKGITAKLLFNESLKYWMAETKYSNAEVRYTSAGFEPLTETIIRNNKVGIIVWVDKPIGFLMTHEQAAKSYDKFFEILWNSSLK